MRGNSPTVALGNTKSMRVGDNVYAIGTPLGEENQSTFTAGMVSAISDIMKGKTERPIYQGSGGKRVNLRDLSFRKR